jgi:MerR family transcriptional regulator/heat shock protein HspR
MVEKKQPVYMIGVVAELLQVHPQTLRLYEREGLVVPSRSKGNTRLYSQEDVEQLKLIMRLTRDLGVNLAGVEVILEMRSRMSLLQQEARELMEYVIRQMGPRPDKTLGQENQPRRASTPRVVPIEVEEKG